MKERPILFSAPMVRALLDGSKTQTRRVMKVQPPSDGFQITTCMSTTGDHSEEGKHRWAKVEGISIVEGGKDYFTCPYGYAGDRLWVRETFLGWWNSADQSLSHVAAFKADGYELEAGERWKPSIHMPRAASRINLEITGVRVEQLQDISEADALAEGITCENAIVGTYYANGHVEVTADRFFFDGCDGDGYEEAEDAYADLWKSINGADSWEANPWVWVVEFRRAA